MSASPEGIVVLGIPVASQRTAKLVRKVMMVSSAMAIVMCINVALSMASGNSFAIVGLAILCIPACGYYGAKNKDPQYLSWFWGCTACCACLSLVSIVGALFTLDRITCLCEGGCKAQEVGMSTDQVAVLCEDQTVWRTELYLALLTALLDFVLQSVACTWGRRLAESDLFVTTHAGVGMGTVAHRGQPRADALPVAQVVGGPGRHHQQGVVHVAPHQQQHAGDGHGQYPSAYPPAGPV